MFKPIRTFMPWECLYRTFVYYSNSENTSKVVEEQFLKDTWTITNREQQSKAKKCCCNKATSLKYHGVLHFVILSNFT